MSIWGTITADHVGERPCYASDFDAPGTEPSAAEGADELEIALAITFHDALRLSINPRQHDAAGLDVDLLVKHDSAENLMLTLAVALYWAAKKDQRAEMREHLLTVLADTLPRP